MVDEAKKACLRNTYLIYPHWAALFFIIGGVILLMIGIPIRFVTGLSAASDRVFAVEALLSGLCVELLFRLLLGRKMVIAPKVRIPFVYFWPLLCLYVFIARPFE